MGAEARLSYLLTAVAGGFAMTVVRNETQRHSAALKNAGQNPIGLLPLDSNERGGCYVLQATGHNVRSAHLPRMRKENRATEFPTGQLPLLQGSASA